MNLNNENNFPLRVLVVDDDPVHLKVASAALEKLGCSVDLATDGTEALALTADQSYDLIFMDISMPGIDGYETTRRIRAQEGPNKKTPIVAASALEKLANADPQMDDYLRKPLGLEEFRLALQLWTRFMRRREPGPQADPPSET